jgi:hypothetical protein
MRVLVCGGRTYNNKALVYSELDALRAKYGWLTIIEGDATGADWLARAWCRERFHGCVEVAANWQRDKNAAGPIRNQLMLDMGKPDMGLAFPGGPGTADMVRRLRAAGVPTKEVKE